MERWLYVFLAGSFLPLVAMAQDTAPKGFFKKDYAIAPGAEGRSNVPVA
jgi:hypothetical protein